MADAGHVQRSIEHNTRWLAYLTEEIEKLGLKVTPSVANFVLVRFPAEPGRDAAAALAFLKTRGILVRGVGGYGLPDCVRVTVGGEEECRVVAAALGDFVAHRG